MDLKDESGITLVELLAALSLLMVVILLAGSIHMFGQKQFMSQKESAEQANDLSYAMSVLSSDIRKNSSTDLTIKSEGNDKPLLEGNEIHLNGTVYKVSGEKLLKGDAVIADSVQSLKAKMTGTYGVTITLTSNSQHSNQKVYETTITFRGVANEPDND